MSHGVVREISGHHEKEDSGSQVTVHAQENEIDFLRSVVKNIVSRDGISEYTHTKARVSYVTIEYIFENNYI